MREKGIKGIRRQRDLCETQTLAWICCIERCGTVRKCDANPGKFERYNGYPVVTFTINAQLAYQSENINSCSHTIRTEEAGNTPTLLYLVSGNMMFYLIFIFYEFGKKFPNLTVNCFFLHIFIFQTYGTLIIDLF